MQNMILIEPQWNVDRKQSNSLNPLIKILIEPQWNVDEEAREVIKKKSEF